MRERGIEAPPEVEPAVGDMAHIVAAAARALCADYGKRAANEAFERALLMLAFDSVSGFRIWLQVALRLASAAPTETCWPVRDEFHA